MIRFDYDLIVIGGGAAGILSSKLAAGLGKKVALVEKRKLGGECTWHGCVPSKALIKSANVLHLLRHSGDYGLGSVQYPPSAPSGVMDHVRGVVQKVYRGHTPEVLRELGIDVLLGESRFLDDHRLDLNGRTLNSRSFIIATGSSAFVPPVEGMGTIPYLTNETLFELRELPASLIVLGGGPIGIELSAALNRLGVETTVVEMFERILVREEAELSLLLMEQLEAEGLHLLTGTKALRFSPANGMVRLTIQDRQGNVRDIEAAGALVAVGRKANTEGLMLENAGVALTQKGITADETLRTTAPHIYACGDVVGPYQFSHVAEYQARIATLNTFLPFKRRVDYSIVGWCMFTEPELAHLGLTEEEATKIHGDSLEVYRFGYDSIDRGRTDVAERGRAKFICGRDGRLLGAHIFGERAGEVIHEAQVLRSFRIPFSKVESMIHIYPTFNDIVKGPARLAYRKKLEQSRILGLLKKIFSGR